MQFNAAEAAAVTATARLSLDRALRGLVDAVIRRAIYEGRRSVDLYEPGLWELKPAGSPVVASERQAQLCAVLRTQGFAAGVRSRPPEVSGDWVRYEHHVITVSW